MLPTNRTRGTPCGMSKVIPINTTSGVGTWMTVASTPEGYIFPGGIQGILADPLLS
jgi:hypothetical protein